MQEFSIPEKEILIEVLTYFLQDHGDTLDNQTELNLLSALHKLHTN